MPKNTSNPASTTKPKFPYTTTPTAFRKFLEEVPKRPKPPKVDFSLLQTWGIKDNNARTILGVVKALGLIDGTGTPTSNYTDFMRNETGASSLATRIREVYSQLFDTSLEPYRDSHENLKNFFNIHSGGSERLIQFQIQTFKALCEHADFISSSSSVGEGPAAQVKETSSHNSPSSSPQIHIDLHIHLPENKNRADYEEILKDIAKYIYDK